MDNAATTTMIRDLPAADRPRERLRDYGAGALSVQELLAILLRTGSSSESALSQAGRIVSHFGGIAGLHAAPFAELCNVRGIGEAKASQLQAALELGMRLASDKPVDRMTVRGPDDIANLLGPKMSALDQEVVRVVLLDTRNRIIAMPEIYRGSVHTTQVRVAELFQEAVRVNAPAIVLVHNHPSGDHTPSRADIQLTKSAAAAGKLLDIELTDHIVIAGGRHSSMRDLNLGFDAEPRQA